MTSKCRTSIIQWIIMRHDGITNQLFSRITYDQFFFSVSFNVILIQELFIFVSITIVYDPCELPTVYIISLLQWSLYNTHPSILFDGQKVSFIYDHNVILYTNRDRYRILL